MASDLEFFFLAVLEGGTRISGCRAWPGSGASAPLALTPSCWVPVWSQAGSASSSPAAPNSNDLSKPPPPTATTLGLGCRRIDPGGVNLSPQRADSEPDPAAGGGRGAFISFRLEPSAGSSKRSNSRDASKRRLSGSAVGLAGSPLGDSAPVTRPGAGTPPFAGGGCRPGRLCAPPHGTSSRVARPPSVMTLSGQCRGWRERGRPGLSWAHVAGSRRAHQQSGPVSGGAGRAPRPHGNGADYPAEVVGRQREEAIVTTTHTARGKA